MLQHLPRATIPALSAHEGTSEERVGARDVMSFVRRYAAGIGVCIGVFLVLGQTYVATTPSTFVSTTQVVIESGRGNWTGVAGDVSFAQYSLDSSQLENQIQIIKSEQIAKRVVQGLDLERDTELTRPGTNVLSVIRGWLDPVPAPVPAVTLVKASPAVRALADRLQARRIGQSYVIEISYWSLDAETSARICNAITAAYIGDLLQSKINAAEGGSEILERRINTLRAQREAADTAVRQGRFVTVTFPSADARVITTALPPESRSWPRGSLVLAFSGLVGLFVGLFAAAAHRGLDTSLRTREQVAIALGLATLGSLPRIRFRTMAKLATEVTRKPTSAFGTAVRQIRTAIQIRQAHMALVCIGITSTAEGEGKTVLCANLAQALAAAGNRVLLVDGDVRAGALTDMLLPEPSESGYVQVVPWQADFLALRGTAERAAPIELPSAAGIVELLALNRKRYDTILIDLPALESGPDAKAIGPHLDGMLFIVEAGHLRSDRVIAAVETLRATNVELLGVVIGKSTSGVSV